MVDKKLINENILSPLLRNDLTNGIDMRNLLEELEYKILMVNNVVKEDKIDSLVNSILEGDTVFLLEGHDKALIIGSEGFQTRAITEPTTSRVVRGPREGFTEAINTNISLIRKKLKTLI